VVPARPEKVGEKQDDRESAAGLELLEEARQDIAENETFDSGKKRGSDEVEEGEAPSRGRRRGPEKVGENRSQPGKNEKDQGFESHSSACQLSGVPLFVVVFSHKLGINAGFQSDSLTGAPGS
jgi:hypothetical protein